MPRIPVVTTTALIPQRRGLVISVGYIPGSTSLRQLSQVTAYRSVSFSYRSSQSYLEFANPVALKRRLHRKGSHVSISGAGVKAESRLETRYVYDNAEPSDAMVGVVMGVKKFGGKNL